MNLLWTSRMNIFVKISLWLLSKSLFVTYITPVFLPLCLVRWSVSLPSNRRAVALPVDTVHVLSDGDLLPALIGAVGALEFGRQATAVAHVQVQWALVGEGHGTFWAGELFDCVTGRAAVESRPDSFSPRGIIVCQPKECVSVKNFSECTID